MTTSVAVSVLMTIMAGAWLSKAMAETPSSFNYLDCVAYNTPSDRATKTCERLLRDRDSLTGLQLDNLARYICVRTIPCTMDVEMSSIPECKLPEASTPEQDKACRKAFLGTNLTVDTNDRSNKMANCEQDVYGACDRYSNFRTYTKVSDVESKQQQTSWALLMFRNETSMTLTSHTQSLIGITAQTTLTSQIVADLSTQMTQHEKKTTESLADVSDQMIEHDNKMNRRFGQIDDKVDWMTQLYHIVLVVVVCSMIGFVVVAMFWIWTRKPVSAVPQSTQRGMTDEERHEIVVHLYDRLRREFTVMQAKTPAPTPTDAEPVPVRRSRPVLRRAAAPVKRSRGL